MTSEIRANKQTNRAGLGTVTYADTGIIVSGIVTANSFSGPIVGDVTINDSIIHRGDTDTKIRFPSADTISMETGGNERLRISSAGKVGIGTDNPQRIIHAFEPSTNNLLFLESGNTNCDIIQADPGGSTRIRSTQGNFYLYTSGDASSSSAANSELAFRIDGDKDVHIYDDLYIPDKIIHTGDTDTAIRFPAADTITAETGGSERLRIDSNGKILVGHTVASADLHDPQNTINRNPNVQLHGSNCVNAGAALISWKNAAGAYYAPALYLAHSGSDTIGTNGILPASGDFGSIIFSGDDGTDFVKGAMIKARLDGTPGNNDMPGKLEFYTTPDGAQVPVERLRIDSSGRVMIGNTAAGQMYSGADNLVIGTTSGENGITIISQSNSVGRILFSDSLTAGAATYQGQINYSHSADELEISTYTLGQIVMKTSNTERLRITSTGQVLIGVNNAVDAEVDLQIHSATSGNGPILNMTNNTGDCRIFFGQDDSSGSANAQGQIRYNVASNYLAAYTAGGERLRITGTGRVNIGDNDRSQNVDQLSVTIGASNALDNVARFQSLAAASGTSETLVKIYKGAGYGGVISGYITQGSDHGLKLYTANNGALSEGLRINSSGAITKPTNPIIKTNMSSTYGSSGSLTTNTANVGILQASAYIDRGDNGWTTSGSNAYTFVCPVDGIYVVHARVSYGNVGGGRKIWVMSYTLGGGNLPLSAYVEVMDHTSASYANYSYYDTYYFTAGTRLGFGRNGGSGSLSGQSLQWGCHLLQ